MTTTRRRENNPYVGPRALQFGEQIYGRDNERLDLLDLLIAERIVLLCSPSGAGKSSLIEAGLRQELIREGFDVLPTARVNTPLPSEIELPPDSNRYVFSVLHSLQDKNAAPGKDVPDPRELPRMNLKEYLDRWVGSDSKIKMKVLVLDQFEEILTINPTDIDGKREFFAQLGAALHDRHRWALFSMREEFLGALDPYLPFVPTRLSVRFRLDLLKGDDAREAIQKTARDAGVEFTDDAAIKLVNDLRRLRVQGLQGGPQERIGPYVEPVQLQVVCFRLWEKLPEDKNQIDVEEVEQSGTVDGALGDYYAERVAEIAKETKVSERKIRDWFGTRLITVQGIRGQVLKGLDQSDGLDNEAIDRLVRVHLVRAEERLNATWYELAHDRLIEPVLKNGERWYQKNLSIVQLNAAQWAKPNPPATLLLRDRKLVEAERWAAEHGQEMTTNESNYLVACRAALSPLQQQSISWESHGCKQELLLQKQSLVEAERWAATNQSELTDIDRNFLNECRAALSPLQQRAILWEVQEQKRKGDLLMQGREMIEAKLWAAEHEDRLSFIDRDFLSACEANLSPLQQQALLWESRRRPNNLLLDGFDLIEAELSILEHGDQHTQSEKAFVEISKQAFEIKKREREQAERERLQARRIRRLSIASIVAAVITVSIAYVGFMYYRKAAHSYMQLTEAQRNANVSQQIAQEESKNANESQTRYKEIGKVLTEEYNAIKKPNGSPDQEVVEETIRINEERRKLFDATANARREKITIRYFPFQENEEKVKAALKELGFKLAIGFSKDFETNAIWYGSEVCKHIEDVQLVAYTLMRAGVKIKLIEPIQTGRENETQVGGKQAARNNRPLTVDDIKNLKPCNQ